MPERHEGGETTFGGKRRWADPVRTSGIRVRAEPASSMDHRDRESGLRARLKATSIEPERHGRQNQTRDERQHQASSRGRRRGVERRGENERDQGRPGPREEGEAQRAAQVPGGEGRCHGQHSVTPGEASQGARGEGEGRREQGPEGQGHRGEGRPKGPHKNPAAKGTATDGTQSPRGRRPRGQR